jgi:hypothetical protein
MTAELEDVGEIRSEAKGKLDPADTTVEGLDAKPLVAAAVPEEFRATDQERIAWQVEPAV